VGTSGTIDAQTPDRPQWGWAGSVEQFLQTPETVWLDSLARHHRGLMHQNPAATQVQAWTEQGQVLRATLRDVCIADPDARRWGLAFEYELPLEGGRRPDVVVLAGRSVIVLEFKQADAAHAAAIDQVAAYARDLSEYHAATHGIRAVPVLVLTRADAPSTDDGAEVVDPASLAGVLLRHVAPGELDLHCWLTAEYAPLPFLVAAARRIFQHEPLPAVRRALSSGIPDAIDLLGRLTEEAAREGGRLLAFVAGVPGSGKTLAGLTLVYERVSRMSAATFLSGNGPLVEVLRDALQSKVFVRDLHAFIKTYGVTTKVPNEHVIVFDEAQRAWDAGYMHHKHGIHRSEPDLLVDIGERLPGWAALVGLVGDGQEIHAGEEGGIGQWHHAVRPSRGRSAWAVHCPPRMVPVFSEVEVHGHDALDLTVSLRSRRADRLHDWVAALLDGRLADAARLAVQIQAEAYPMYVTRDLDAARHYAWDRYASHPEARYGLLASARTQSYLPKWGVDTSWPATKRVKLARWYNEGRGHPQSCCQLADVVTEFGCQGLELDLPIVCWGDDVRWTGTAWAIRPVRAKYPLHDSDQLRRNAYRVLLTRGRDGLVVFVPPDPAMDHTEHALLAAGVRPLPEVLAQAVVA
jgi:DUF2075 family protein